MPRLGRVVFDLGYVVDLDNDAMVEDAKTCVIEDIHNAIKYGELEQYLEIREDPDAKVEDIPEFLTQTEEADNDDD